MAGAAVIAVPGARAASFGMGAPLPVAGWWTPCQGAFWLDVPTAATRLGPVEVACTGPAPAPETMAADAAAGASAPLPGRERGPTRGGVTTPEAALASPEAKSRFHLNGQKYASPVGSRSEAGVAMSLGSHLSVQLNYARTAQVPMMGYASDNGILARLRFGF